MLKLSRIQTFFIGTFAILLFYLLNRGNQLIGSEQVEGKLLYYVSVDTNVEMETEIFPVLGFEYRKKEYEFNARAGSGYDKNKVIPILIKNGNPEAPIIYTIETFWLYPLFYCLLPFAIWAAFSLSYIDKKEQLFIRLTYPFFKKEIKNVTSSNDLIAND